MFNRTWSVKLGVLLITALIYFFIPQVHNLVVYLVSLFASLDIQAVKVYILSFGVWAPVVSFLLMVFQSVAAPLPAFLITFANAALFGWVNGALLSWSSAMAGAVVCFYIARFFGRDLVEKLTSSMALASIDEFFSKHGKYAILIARLLPFISFDLVSYAAGLTSMGFWEFFVATGIGQLPATIIYSYVGDMLVGSARTFVFGLLSLFALSALAVLIKNLYQARSEQRSSKD